MQSHFKYSKSAAGGVKYSRRNISYQTYVLPCHLLDRCAKCDSGCMWVLSHFVGCEDSRHHPWLNHQMNFRSSSSSSLGGKLSPTGNMGQTSRHIKWCSRRGQIEPARDSTWSAVLNLGILPRGIAILEYFSSHWCMQFCLDVDWLTAGKFWFLSFTTNTEYKPLLSFWGVVCGFYIWTSFEQSHIFFRGSFKVFPIFAFVFVVPCTVSGNQTKAHLFPPEVLVKQKKWNTYKTAGHCGFKQM